VLDIAFYCKYLGIYTTDLTRNSWATGSARLQSTTSLMPHAEVPSEMWTAYCGRRLLNEEEGNMLVTYPCIVSLILEFMQFTMLLHSVISQT
jgi:hypothetical protein